MIGVRPKLRAEEVAALSRVHFNFTCHRHVQEMDACAALVEKLKSRSDLAYTEGNGSVLIDAPTKHGFAVELVDDGDRWMVCLGKNGFHMHFDDPLEALNFVAWCYSGEARIREISKGTTILETYSNDSWHEIGMTAPLAKPFWKKLQQRVYHNPKMLRD